MLTSRRPHTTGYTLIYGKYFTPRYLARMKNDGKSPLHDPFTIDKGVFHTRTHTPIYDFGV